MSTEERFRPVCPCPVMPVNYWRVGGRWVPGATLGPVDTERAAVGDADRYNASGADAWRIACPDRGRVFAQSNPPPSSRRSPPTR